MKLLFASDLFKGTLPSERIIQPLEATAGRTFPDCETAGVSVAGGGEGIIDAVISALNGTYRRLMVHGLLMEETRSSYGESGGDSTIIEMAATSRPPVVPTDKRNPLNTTTYGTKELIRDVLDRGYRKILIAIGGNVTNDGGVGAIRVLGVRFLDDQGNELEGGGGDLTRVADIDVNRMHPVVAQTGFTVTYDVIDLLMGSDGATYISGKQKGGTSEILDVLEGGMVRYVALLKEKLDVDVDRIPGADTAGGSGVAFCVFLKVNLKSSIDTVLDLVYFSSLLERADLVTTGEDRMDRQSAFGEVPSGIGKRCRGRGIPVAAIVGGIGDKARTIFDYGTGSTMTTISGTMDIEEALERAEKLYVSTTDRTFKMLKAGMSLERK